MALVEYPTPITYMNKKQLQAMARNRNLNFTAETTQAELVTLLNA